MIGDAEPIEQCAFCDGWHGYTDCTERDSSPPRDDDREPSKSVVSGRDVTHA